MYLQNCPGDRCIDQVINQNILESAHHHLVKIDFLRLFISFPKSIVTSLLGQQTLRSACHPAPVLSLIMSHLNYFNIILNQHSSFSLIPFYSILHVPLKLFLENTKLVLSLPMPRVYCPQAEVQDPQHGVQGTLQFNHGLLFQPLLPLLSMFPNAL